MFRLFVSVITKELKLIGGLGQKTVYKRSEQTAVNLKDLDLSVSSSRINELVCSFKLCSIIYTYKIPMVSVTKGSHCI